MKKKKSNAVHVATTRRTYKGKVYEAHLLRRTYREDGKVKHQTLGNISHLPMHIIENIRRGLKGEALVSMQDALECVRSLPHGHVAAVHGTLRKLGVERLVASKSSRMRDLVEGMITARVLDPGSKLATARALSEEAAASTLGEVLGITNASEDELYAAMDWLLPRQEKIEKALAARHLDNTFVLYDATSAYFEGRKCPLAKLGRGKDGKNGKLQIVIGLLCNSEGCPVAVEVFEGNTGDPATLTAQVEKIRKRFGISRIALVGDRGTITDARIRKDIDPVKGLSWITALRAPAIRTLMRAGEISRSLFDETDIAEIRSPDHPGQRLVVCFNPFLADERARKRNDLLKATEAEFAKIVAATRRDKRRLAGAAEIGLKVGGVCNKFKVAKHFELTITEDSFSYQRKVEQISEEVALDGIYVVRTDVPEEEMSAENTVRAYKSLSHVERAFRTLKGVDLKVRPIYHRLAGRVRAHVFLCMLAYYVEWHMRQALAEALFADHDRKEAEAERLSVVAKACKSKAARKKASTKRTTHGEPVHSFRTLMSDLSTIVVNRMRPKGAPDQTYSMMTLPTDNQRRIFTLLDVPLRL